MSTSHRAVMLCGWGVKGGIAFLFAGKLCIAISKRFLENALIVFKGALQMSRFTLLVHATPTALTHDMEDGPTNWRDMQPFARKMKTKHHELCTGVSNRK